MDTTVQGIVLKVEGKTSKKGNVYFAVSFSDGKTYTTFDNGLAQQAQALQGQPVEAQVEVSQSGQYTNYNLKAIRPSNATVSTLGVAQPGPIPMAAPAPQGEDPLERSTRIVRQSSMATAFNFVGHILSGSGDLEAAKTHALALAKELFGHAFHGGSPASASAASPAQGIVQTAPEVAAQVNEVLGTTAVTQGAPEAPVASPGATKDW